VFHCSALVKDYGKKKNFYKINFEGTKNIFKLCQKNNVRKFIFLGHLDYKSGNNIGYYSKTKRLAEIFLIDKYNKIKFPVIIIRPGNVYGPGANVWVIKPLKAIKKNRIALIDKGEGIFHHTYIDNLIDALILSIKEPRAIGKIIEITDGTNENTWGEYLNILARLAGKKPIERNISKNIALILSYCMLIFYNLFRIKPFVTPTAVNILSNKKEISIEPAIELLNYNPSVDFKTGMKKVEIWLRNEGYIQ